MKNLKEILKPFYYRIMSYLNGFYKEEPIFIVGCPHSGTTLLLRIFATHKDVYAVNYESHAFGKGRKGLNLMRSWLEERKKRRKSKILEKTPRHLNYVHKIFALFPKARIIVMLRDGRDVTVSLRKRFGDSTEGLERWVNDNQKVLEFKNSTKIKYLKLEDLVIDSEEEIRKVCNFSGLIFYDELLNYHNKEFDYYKGVQTNGKKHNKINLKRRKEQINTPILKNTSKWEQEATKEELNLFNDHATFGVLMRDLGYK